MSLDVHGHRRIDRWITFILRSGMLLSMGIMILGLLLYALFPSQSSTVVSIQQIPNEIAKGNGQAILLVGILVLIATPLARILTAMAVFIIDRDLKFIALCTLVLIVLLVAVLVRPH